MSGSLQEIKLQPRGSRYVAVCIVGASRCVSVCIFGAGMFHALQLVDEANLQSKKLVDGLVISFSGQRLDLPISLYIFGSV